MESLEVNYFPCPRRKPAGVGSFVVGVGLINDVNKLQQYGFLIFEPLCRQTSTQASAKIALPRHLT
ncbi:MAG TPA: hypothetical protein VJ464_24310 [Blastocatellia bacterium]|nr:hypothetical protein [Blastocatellia bacterium]